MAANRQQGGYLAEFIASFTLVPAGLITLSSVSPILGVLLTIAGLALGVHSCVGFHRIKRLEFINEP